VGCVPRYGVASLLTTFA